MEWNGTSKRLRSAREWLDDVREWYKQDMHIHSEKWRKIVPNGEKLRNMHATPTGIEPMEQKKKKQDTMQYFIV